MPAFLLHVSSKISIHHIEDALHRFEREALSDRHYLLGRGTRCSNYVLCSDEPLDHLHARLTRQAESRFALEWVSLVEIRSPWEIIEPAIVLPPGWGEDDEEWPAVLDDDSLASPDHCGQFQRARTDESYFHPEFIRIRTGLKNWLERYARADRWRSKEDRSLATAVLLHLHHRLSPDDRWLSHLRAKLGRSCLVYMREETSVLLTWRGVSPAELFIQPRFQSFLRDSRVHTAFSFKVGEQQKHANAIQAVLPRVGPPLKPSKGAKQPTQTPVLVVSRKSGIEPPGLREALEKLRASRRAR